MTTEASLILNGQRQHQSRSLSCMYICAFAIEGEERIAYEVMLPSPIPVGSTLLIEESAEPTAMRKGTWIGGAPSTETVMPRYQVVSHTWMVSNTKQVDPRDNNAHAPKDLPEGTIYIFHVLRQGPHE